MRKSFLQSDEWAEFQKRLGRNCFDVQGIKVIEHKIALKKSFLYVPRVNIVGNFENFIKETRKIAKKENAVFLKLEPVGWQAGYQKEIDENLLKKHGFKKSNNIQPLQTIILDLTKTEGELLNAMHQKTRYNINLAQKKGIEIKIQDTRDKKQTYFEDFWKLMGKTSGRDGFKAYSKTYYQKMLEISGTELFVAEHQNKIIVANIVLFYKNTAIYLHGASNYEYRNLMAPYLLQWEQIKEAKRRGCDEYDFWGINEIKWPGVTRFKRGFGGQEIAYPGAYDLVFKLFWYRIYKTAKAVL